MKPGDRVRYVRDAPDESDNRTARQYLVRGDYYTIQSCAQWGPYEEVMLREIPMICFAPVLFDIVNLE